MIILRTIITLHLFLSTYYSKDIEPCSNFQTCEKCLKNDKCFWCTDPDSTDVYRCMNVNDDINKCSNSFKEKIIPVVNSDDSNRNDSFVKPTKLNIETFQGNTAEQVLTIGLEENFPLDVVFVVDVSKTMINEIQSIKDIGQKITSSLNSITNNIKFGLSVFIDKKKLPAITESTKNDYYTFKVSQPLTENIDDFKSEMDQIKTGSNEDNLEGSFDALAAVANCQNVNWRDRSIKVAILLTDSLPHTAGDEKVFGIFENHNEECIYKGQLKSDRFGYPSISSLKNILENKGIIPIMVVKKPVEAFYREVAEYWNSVSACMGVISQDDVNAIIDDSLKKATKTIKAPSYENADVIVKSKLKCSPNDSDFKDECTDITPGKHIQAYLQIISKTCKKFEFKLQMSGYGKVVIEVNSICECNCSKNLELSSLKCNNGGDLKCGECDCLSSKIGKRCECDVLSSSANIGNCVQQGTSNLCSGRGSCVCNKCSCYRNYYGKYCECSDDECPTFQEKICAGRGECKCNACKCSAPWLGSSCEVEDCNDKSVNDRCLSDSSKKICSGNGLCNCGKCKCNGDYFGDKCQFCETCGLKCQTYKDCMIDIIFNGMNAPCPGVHTITEVTSFNTQIICKFKKDNCFYDFSVIKNFDTEKIFIFYKKHNPDNDCEIKVNVGTLVGGVVGGILLIALLIIILIKLLLFYYARREYRAFLKEQGNRSFKEMNPLYKESKLSYVNPMKEAL